MVQNENTLLLWTEDTGQKVTINTDEVSLMAKEMWNKQPRKLILILLK